MNIVNIVNLTPHALNLKDMDGNTVTVPASGTVARLEERRVVATPINNLKVSKSIKGQVENLPAPQEGVVYVVSAYVLDAVPDRPDVFSPGELLRDEQGRTIGAEGLTCTAAYLSQNSPNS